MKITYPHLGNAYISIEELLAGLGHETVTPPPGTKRTLELGSALSPEHACLPFKIILGNMLEGIEAGANSVLMIGGCGPCRLGYYGEIQRILLRQAGCDIRFLTIEPPGKYPEGTGRFLRTMLGQTQPLNLIRKAKLAWAKLEAVEWLEKQALKARPGELRKGAASQLLNRLLAEVRRVENIGALKEVCRAAAARFDALCLPDNGRPPLRIGLVGEIYTLVEPFANLNIEIRLGELGVEVVRTVSLQSWVEDHIFKKLVGRSHLVPLQKSARGYLRGFIGGHGLESVARSVDLARLGLGGVIHILPLACMPEVVAQGILPQVSADSGMPIMSLVVDEHSSETGIRTRLEAFVDLVERRRSVHV